MAAMNDTFIVATLICICGILIALLIKNKKSTNNIKNENNIEI
jgi:preprotein translocase subunit SecG